MYLAGCDCGAAAAIDAQTRAPTDPPLLLKIPQAAARLSMSEQTVGVLTRSGQLPTVRVGRSVFIRAADLVAYAEGLI